MSEKTPVEPGQPANDVRCPPCWNIVSVALPLFAVVVGVLLLAANPSGQGDYAGAMGGAVLLVVCVATACGLGLIVAVVALVRRERMPWFTAIGLLGNGAVLVPVIGLMLRD